MSEKAKPLAGCHILFVEGDYFVGMEIDQVLTEAGATVVGPIGDVKGAMEAAKQEGFGLALLDLNVRGGLIYAIADELRRNGIPFFFALDFNRDEVPERFRDVPCWQKPGFNEEELVNKLAGVCHAVSSSASPSSATRP